MKTMSLRDKGVYSVVASLQNDDEAALEDAGVVMDNTGSTSAVNEVANGYTTQEESPIDDHELMQHTVRSKRATLDCSDSLSVDSHA